MIRDINYCWNWNLVINKCTVFREQNKIYI